MADISVTITAKSDQINADDLIGREITAQIVRVLVTSEEQPVTIHLDGHKHWRPSKTDRRVLAAAWGTESDRWVGQWVHLYRDPEVRFGGQAVGGIRVGALSGISKPLKVAVNASKGKKAMIEVRPLTPPTAAAKTPDLLAVLSGAGLTLADLDAWLIANGKPASGDGTEKQRAALAAWLVADPARLEAVRPAAEPDPTPEEAPVAEERAW
jgi:hypothetical protein